MERKRVAALSQQNGLRMFVLDVLRHDAVEQIPSIVRLLNDSSGSIGWRDCWPHDFSTSEIVPVLFALVRDGYARALQESSVGDELHAIPAGQFDAEQCQEAWFELTESGRRLLDEWEPPSD